MVVTEDTVATKSRILWSSTKEESMSTRRTLTAFLVAGAMMVALAVPAFAAQGQITEVNPSGITVQTPSGVSKTITPKGFRNAQPSPPAFNSPSQSPGASD
jgi:ABC-type sugar transport system substrate-binding protein